MEDSSKSVENISVENQDQQKKRKVYETLNPDGSHQKVWSSSTITSEEMRQEEVEVMETDSPGIKNLNFRCSLRSEIECAKCRTKYKRKEGHECPVAQFCIKSRQIVPAGKSAVGKKIEID